MKRMIALMLTLLMLFSTVPALAAGADLSYEQAAAMAQHMRDLAAGDYLMLQGATEKLVRLAREWTAGVNETPRLVVKVDIENMGRLLC